MEIFSEYIRRDHFLSRIDARIKLSVSLIVLGMLLSYRGLLFPSLITAICLLLCLSMRVSLRIFLLRFSGPLFVAIILLMLKFLFTGHETLFSLKVFGLTISGQRDGLMEGLEIALRIVGAVSVLSVLGFSTGFIELIGALSWMRVPRTFVEILLFAYRYIFVLLDEAMVIYNAQKNRLGYSGIMRGLNSFGILVGSLILKAFEKSQEITDSMIQRGYDGRIPVMNQKPLRLNEVIGGMVVVILVGILWVSLL